MVWAYLRSTTTKIGFFAGLLFYCSYGYFLHRWTNLGNIGVSLFLALGIPQFSKFSNYIEEICQKYTASITPGRILRFVFQALINSLIFAVLVQTGVVTGAHLDHLGGLFGIALLTTLNSQGAQLVALSLANREIGSKNMNVIAAITLNIVITCAALAGTEWLRAAYLTITLSLGALFITLGLFSDLRSLFPASGGVGIFFGTFNPMHRTHIDLIRKLIHERQVERVYIHATVIPKLHREALSKGEIVLARRDRSMRVYEKTPYADRNVNYFPTGKYFYEYSTRKLMMQIQLQEAGLADSVHVLDMPEIYSSDGFYGIVSHIKKLHPKTKLHGIHGSDLGGMWIRGIYDESGWIYPFSVTRKDSVSATAIRNGEKGMMTTLGELIVSYLNAGAESFTINGRTLNFRDGDVINERV